jgi:outer membrane protein OmpA-like peptidoglycan-associated protein
MSTNLTTKQKIGGAIGILILIGGAILLYRILTKSKRECEKEGGVWDNNTKTCKLPEKPKAEIVKKAYDNLTFQSGKDVILASSFPTLNELADYLKTIPAFSLTLEGHTDSQGDDDYNLKLSEKRAISVKKYLVNKGVEESRIKAVGYGETKPIADNATAEGRNKNRRVEFIIT